MKYLFIDIGSEKTVSVIINDSPNPIIAHSLTKSIKFTNNIYDIDIKNSIAQNLANLSTKTYIDYNISTSISISSLVCSKRYETFQVSVLSKNSIAYIDIQNLLYEAEKNLAINNKKILHIIPVEFSVNGEDAIYNPIGKKGEILQAKLMIIEIEFSLFSHIKELVKSLNLKLHNIYMDSYAASFSTLSYNEKNDGSILIDFGSSKTCIMFFHKNTMLYFQNIKLGFHILIDDIMKNFDVSYSEAIRIRNLYTISHAQANNISKLENDAGKSIQINKISQIINNHVNNIVNKTINAINKVETNNEDLNTIWENNIVITGGGSITPYLKKELGKSLSTPRVSELGQFSHIINDNQNPGTYATVLGMIEEHNEQIKNKNKISIVEKFKVQLNNLLNWLNK